MVMNFIYESSSQKEFEVCPRKIYSPKKVTHNILVYRQVQIIVAVTYVLYTGQIF